MMRVCMVLWCVLLLPGCIAWWEVQPVALSSSPKQNYATAVRGYVAQVMMGKGATPDPRLYDVGTCFSQEGRERPFIESLTLGASAPDVVCRQYSGVDLRTEDARLLSCFPKDARGYRHPWTASNPSAECQALIKRMRGRG